jgi:hypothetical protein
MSQPWSQRFESPWIVVDHPLGLIRILSGDLPVLDPGPVDVHVHRPTGQHLVATFASLSDVQRLMTAAFWASDLVIVPTLSVDTVVAAIEWLVAEKELAMAFAEADPIGSAATFTWGDAVIVGEAAPRVFRPGEAGDVVGISGSPDAPIYYVEFADGFAVEIPAKWLGGRTVE